MALHGISIKPSHKGLFHKDVGKKPGAKITSADIDKGLASKNPAERKRANFAKNARKWNKGGKAEQGKAKSTDRAERLYGKKG